LPDLFGVRRSARTELSYCAAGVREREPERYLATLFAPAEAREPLFTLYAFDHEIARVRSVVSEPMAGMIRFQWWRDALEGVEAGRPLAHPVVAALQAHWTFLRPLRPHLDDAIDARELELTSDPPADLAALEERLEAGCAAITCAAIDLLGASGEETHAAARHLGLALGLIRLVRGLAGDLRQNRLMLPTAMLRRHAIEPAVAAQAASGGTLAPEVADLAVRARQHLAKARQHRGRICRSALAVLLCAPLLDDYLDRLARAQYDPLAIAGRRPAPWAPLELIARYALGRY
jgi:NADH dehydrogenase [ubiquinone] 1 alpha subcomplex assembly factor 6